MTSNNFLQNCLKLISLNKKKCVDYRNFLNSQKINLKKIKKIEDLPFLHVNQFKKRKLFSIPENEIFKIIKSSGTSSSEPSKIYIDKKSALKQQKILNMSMYPITKGKRKPMIIFEQNLSNHRNKNSFDASKAAVIGFSVFGKDHLYLRKSNNQLDYKKLNLFLKRYQNYEIIIFGFTANIYEYLIKKLKKKKLKYNLSNSIIIHGGGWKKLSYLSISKKKFENLIYKKYKIKKIFNYYGMVEQIGSVFFQCKECGYFHENDNTKVIIRDENLNSLVKNKKGFLQLVSTVPESYPGNSLLTEDYARIVDSKCSKPKKFKQFEILGRVERAEIRGCSDVG
jgi:phenylacetate-coenzyme A ligase PaaK-like adenylate-forming protein